MSAYSTYSDEALLEMLKESDKKAFSEIYERYWEPLFVLANNRLKKHMEAEEAVEDVFISIWNRRAALDIRHKLKTYLSVSVKHNVLRRLADQWSKMLDIDVADLSGEAVDSTGLWLAAKELEEQLNYGISLLPEKCRIVFVKSRKEGKSNARIAAELNISEKTVEGHITRATRTLRESIGVSLVLLLHLLDK